MLKEKTTYKTSGTFKGKYNEMSNMGTTKMVSLKHVTQLKYC